MGDLGKLYWRCVFDRLFCIIKIKAFKSASASPPTSSLAGRRRRVVIWGGLPRHLWVVCSLVQVLGVSRIAHGILGPWHRRIRLTRFLKWTAKHGSIARKNSLKKLPLIDRPVVKPLGKRCQKLREPVVIIGLGQVSNDNHSFALAAIFEATQALFSSNAFDITDKVVNVGFSRNNLLEQSFAFSG